MDVAYVTQLYLNFCAGSRRCMMPCTILQWLRDSIMPGKYTVNGYPSIHEFPSNHPNKKLAEMKAKSEL